MLGPKSHVTAREGHVTTLCPPDRGAGRSIICQMLQSIPLLPVPVGHSFTHRPQNQRSEEACP